MDTLMEPDTEVIADTSDDVEPDLPPPNLEPEAVVIEPIVGFAGQPITLDGSGSSDPDGTLVEHRWLLGDDVLLGEQVAYTWEMAGRVTGTLQVTDDQGAMAETSFEVTVRDPADGRPVAVIALSEPIAQVGQEATLNAEGSSDPDGTIETWLWRLEGEALTEAVEATEESWVWTFDQPGDVSVTLTVTDNDGLTDTSTRAWRVGVTPEAVMTLSEPPYTIGEPIMMSATESNDPDGSIVAYQWDFGDGQTSRNIQAQHVYTVPGEVTVALTVTDGDGLTDTTETVLNIGEIANQPPVAAAGPDVFGDVGVAIRFNGLASQDPDGTIVAYRWDFGDGTEGMGESPTHAYGAEGNYTVTLTVVDDRGAEDSDTLTATVGSANEPPIAEAGPDQSVPAGSVVMLDGSGSNDFDGTLVSYQWDFGDGQSSVGMMVSHTYANVGSYTVTLTVTDDVGDTGSDTMRVTVTQPNRPPNPAFSANPNPVPAGTLVTFNASASTDPDGDNIVAYQWDFGDGTPLQFGQIISYAYTQGGVYQATLTTTDPGGASASVATLITVEAPEGYDGLWEVLPFDTRDTYGATCGSFDIEIGPASCETTVTGSSIVFNCGADTYRGTLSGDNFDVNLDFNPQYDPFCLGDVWFDERITGTYTSTTRWQGQSYTRLLTDGLFCFTCPTIDPYPFQKTGNRLE
ncbi:MAG: PKD domain-containing protein [Myxococcota bacterium]